MTHWIHIVLAGASGALLALVSACGVVGPPIAPENVGVNPTITRQKAQLQQSGTVQPADSAMVPAVPAAPVEPKGQDEELPPLRPVGTR